MPTLVAIDTSTEACSVAVYRDGEITERFDVLPRQHAARLLPMLEELMRGEGVVFSALDAVAFGRGPGSFTGLRIAAGAAQGLAFGLEVPVLPVSTLAALALQAHRANGAAHVLSCLDARIGEVYWGLFRVNEEEVTPLQEERLCAPEEVRLPEVEGVSRWSGTGNGWSLRERMPQATHDRVDVIAGTELPRAGAVALLAARDLAAGRGLPPEQAAPVYLRDKVTHSKAERGAQ